MLAFAGRKRQKQSASVDEVDTDEDDDDDEKFDVVDDADAAAAGQLGVNKTCSASVERRNLRERRRVKQINVTFATLRNRLPVYCWKQQQLLDDQQPQKQQRRRRSSRNIDGRISKRPSKVDTLRTAIDYIRALQQLLEEHDALQHTLPSSDEHLTLANSSDAGFSSVGDFVPPEMTSYGSGSPSASASTDAGCSSLDDLEAVFSGCDSPASSGEQLDLFHPDSRRTPAIQAILEWLM